MALISVLPAVADYSEKQEGDRKSGAKIILRVLEEPVRQIAENAGFEGSVVVSEVKSREKGIGFNAASEEYVDMIKEGIVDPAKVTRSAIQNAASVSSMLLTTEATVSEIKSNEPEMPAMGGMNGMGGMGGMM